MAKFVDHDAYAAAAPESHRPVLAMLRVQLAAALPDARELIMYDMPGFAIGETVVASYAAFSKQCGLYAAGGGIVTCTDDLAAAGLKPTKTGVTFPPSRPIPEDLVRKIALAARQGLGL